MSIAKWGNSLAVRLPASVVKALGLKEGDDIELFVIGSREAEVPCKPDVEQLLSRIRSLRGRLPPDFRFDRLEANERGGG